MHIKVHHYTQCTAHTDHEVTSESPGGDVVYTAGPVGDVRHDDCLRRRELLDDVAQGRGEHCQTLGQLGNGGTSRTDEWNVAELGEIAFKTLTNYKSIRWEET